MEEKRQITQLLGDWRSGDQKARDRLFAVVYDDLRAIAHRERYRLGAGETMNTTGLVHDLYLKIAARSQIGAEDRVHFYRLASKALRNLLVDYARSQRRLKRGGQHRHSAPVREVAEGDDLLTEADHIVDVHHALTKLESRDPRQAAIVELRFFGGLTHEEVGETIGVSEKTVRREWFKAKRWLRQQLAITKKEPAI